MSSATMAGDNTTNAALQLTVIHNFFFSFYLMLHPTSRVFKTKAFA
jgi:hypothetical protein